MQGQQEWKLDSDQFFCENLLTEFGDIQIQHISSDRGRLRCTKITTLGKHNKILNLIPHYFFDELTAKSEIAQWVNLAKAFVLDENLYDTIISLVPNQVLHGRFCMITFGRFYTMPKVSEGFFFHVTSPKEIDQWLSIDYMDILPRYFTTEEAAKTEAEAWLLARSQQADFSKWADLKLP